MLKVKIEKIDNKSHPNLHKGWWFKGFLKQLVIGQKVIILDERKGLPPFISTEVKTFYDNYIETQNSIYKLTYL